MIGGGGGRTDGRTERLKEGDRHRDAKSSEQKMPTFGPKSVNQ